MTETARELFLAGVRIGASATTDPTDTTFARWRRDTLGHLTPGSWKHSVVDLVPGPRFRPFEIYTRQRDELQRRHPEHDNLKRYRRALRRHTGVPRGPARSSPGAFAPQAGALILE